MIYTQFNPYMLYMPCIKKRRYNQPSIVYYNIPVAFDIETTSYSDKGNKQAYCYVWQMCFDTVCVHGRTLEEFKDFIKTLQQCWGLNDCRRLIIYVHNLEYEFQFIRKYFKWDSIFAREKRHPIYAISEGCEYRCSYMLSLLSLSTLAEQNNTGTYKLTGDLDYTLIRHSKTIIKQSELDYGYNDVRIVCDYIRQEIKHNNNDISQIPLTKTGYVRRECRQALQADSNYWYKYKQMLNDCMPDKDLFVLLYKAYAGGYTHANSRYVGLTLDNVKSIDFASSYPFCMVCNKFPWKFTKYDCKSLAEFEHFIQNKACVFEVAFEHLRPKTTTTILSSNKCSVLDGAKLDNGRVLFADFVVTYMTDLDYKNFKRFYTWDYITVGSFYWANLEPLPRPLVKVILDKYTDKTTLKGVIGKEREYMVSKGIINGVYGMCCTNPVNDIISYNNDNDEWTSDESDIDDVLAEQRNNRNTFLLYQWGVWVSAWARYNLLNFVADIEPYVVYCDTDSIKYVNDDIISNMVNAYNNKVIALNKQIEREYSYTIPTTKQGNKAWLGVFDSDGDYKQFKTLGAKRYMYTPKDNDKVHITISGLCKSAADYINTIDKPYDFFADGMTIPSDYTGKLTRTYIDNEYSGILIDYRGVSDYVHSPSAIHLSPQDFTLSIVPNFKKLFTTMQSHPMTGKSLNGKIHRNLTININDIINTIREELINGKT